jgi:hypothetical protein
MKNLPEENWLANAKEKLANYHDVPDESVWHGIETQLPRRSNRKAAFLAISAIIGLSILVGRYLHHQNEAVTLKPLAPNNLVDSHAQYADRHPLPPMSSSQAKEYVKAQSFDSKKSMKKTPLVNEANDFTLISSKNLDSYNDPLPESIKTSDFSLTEVSKPDSASQVLIALDTTRKVKAVKEESKEKPKRIKTLRGFAFFSPSLSFYRVEASPADNMTIDRLNSPSLISTQRLGFGISSGIELSIGKKIDLYSGATIYYQSQILSYRALSNTELTFEKQNASTYLISPTMKNEGIEYKMLNVGIRLGALYLLTEGKMKHKMGGGLLFESGLLNSPRAPYTNSGSFYGGYEILYRIEVESLNGYQFFVQPFFHYTLMSNERLDIPINVYPYRAGISFGISKLF